jgi:hypothetical protein
MAVMLMLVVVAVAAVPVLGYLLAWPVNRLLDPLYEPLAHKLPRRLSSDRLQQRVLGAALNRISIGVNGGVMAPTAYEVRLHPDDVELLGGLRDWFANELSGAIFDKARERGAPVSRPPTVTIVEDDTRPYSRPAVDARFETPTQVVGGAPAFGEAEPATAVEHATVALATWVLVPDGPDAGPHDEGAIRLTGTEVVLGRSRSADATLDDATVSSKHARFRSLPDGSWEVADLGSTNGTSVNDRRLDGPATLAAGDRVRIGSSAWRLERR